MPALHDAVLAVRHHHERWDGSGYPDGLAGARIPAEARVVAVADAYCALATGASDHGAARAELEQQAGSRLDPECVRALLAVVARAEPTEDVPPPLGIRPGSRRSL